MAKLKYNVENAETRKVASAGVHLMKIVSIRDREDEGKEDWEVIVEVKTGDDKGARVWSYLNQGEASAWKLRQFTDALGLKPKGVLDTDKLVGKEVGALVEQDDYKGDPRAKIKTWLDPASAVADEDEDGEDLDDVTEDEDEGEEVDLEELDFDELTELVEEEELDVDIAKVVGKSKGKVAERKLRAAIEAAMEEADEEDEDEEDEDDEDDEESYEDMDLSDLVALAKERKIKLTVKERKDKQVIIDKLEEADEADEADDDEEDEDDEPEPPAKKSRAGKQKLGGKTAAKVVEPEEDDDDEESEDYSEWDDDDLREELESRGLSNKGTKAVMIKRLERDDSKSGTKPF